MIRFQAMIVFLLVLSCLAAGLKSRTSTVICLIGECKTLDCSADLCSPSGNTPLYTPAPLDDCDAEGMGAAVCQYCIDISNVGHQRVASLRVSPDHMGFLVLPVLPRWLICLQASRPPTAIEGLWFPSSPFASLEVMRC